MDDNKILEITSQMEETLGKENYAMVSDSIGELITGNESNLKAIADLKEENQKLQDRNEKLVSANGALLQKIPAERKISKEEKEVKSAKINLMDAFDANGNFKR